MSILIWLLMLAGGFYLLYKGADWLVDSASALAYKMGISTLIIGLTIVAFGTSLPEFVVSFIATLGGQYDIAFGNVLGSNIANVFLILGLTALLKVIPIAKQSLKFEIPLALLASITMLVLTLDQNLSYTDGIIFLFGFVIFLLYIILSVKKNNQDEKKNTKQNQHVSLFLIIGLLTLILGGKLTVTSASHIAQTLGLSAELIGLTIVAVGTSLPELFTSIIGILKGETDLVVGNIVGSNIFNTFFILGMTSLIHPTFIASHLFFDLSLNVLTFIVILVFSLINKEKFVIKKWQGIILLCFYIFYCFMLVRRELI